MADRARFEAATRVGEWATHGRQRAAFSRCRADAHGADGWCDIGDYCFMGVNTTLANNTSIGGGSWVGHGACLSGEVPEKSLVKAVSSEIGPLNEAVLFRTLSRSSKARNR